MTAARNFNGMAEQLENDPKIGSNIGVNVGDKVEKEEAV
jgi:hypothetical protein